MVLFSRIPQVSRRKNFNFKTWLYIVMKTSQKIAKLSPCEFVHLFQKIYTCRHMLCMYEHYMTLTLNDEVSASFWAVSSLMASVCSMFLAWLSIRSFSSLEGKNRGKSVFFPSWYYRTFFWLLINCSLRLECMAMTLACQAIGNIMNVLKSILNTKKLKSDQQIRGHIPKFKKN